MERFELAGRRVWVAGHRGMLGSALVRRLSSEPCKVLTIARDEVDLRRQSDVEHWMKQSKPNVIFLAAARVGGIAQNISNPAEFLYDNLMIQSNIMHAAANFGTEALVNISSSAVYPKGTQQPMTEELIMTGALDPSNEGYALAKIAGIKLCDYYGRQFGKRFFSVLPANMYGPGDNFSDQRSHVVPSLIKRAHKAKNFQASHFEVWGTGAARREFLFVDDVADACVFLFKNYNDCAPLNLGHGSDISIRELARLIAKTVGFEGDARFDNTQPAGVSVRRLDVTIANRLGWTPKVSLSTGLAETYRWYQTQKQDD